MSQVSRRLARYQAHNRAERAMFLFSRPRCAREMPAVPSHDTDTEDVSPKPLPLSASRDSLAGSGGIWDTVYPAREVVGLLSQFSSRISKDIGVC